MNAAFHTPRKFPNISTTIFFLGFGGFYQKQDLGLDSNLSNIFFQGRLDDKEKELVNQMLVELYQYP